MVVTPRDRAGRRLSLAALGGLILGAGGVAAVALSAVGYRNGWWPLRDALQVARWGAYAAALGLVLSLAGLVLARPGGRRRGFGLALLGLALSLPMTAIAVHWEYAARAYPRISDVSTDLDDPPVFWAMPDPTEHPGGETAALQRAGYPDLAPLALPLAPGRAHALALGLARERGWEILAEEAGEGRIEAVDSSLAFGFKDEVVIRIRASDGGARVDMRSRSRVGRVDRGVNAKRIRSFLAALDDRAR